jgi:carboxyl-terminal processing protease
MIYRFVLIFLLSSTAATVAQPAFDCRKVATFKQLLDVHHVNPQAWDDTFASKTIEQFFKLVDPQALLFSNDEVKLFIANAKKLDDALLKGDCSFINEISPFYKKALDRAERLITDVKNAPIDFTLKDTLVYNIFGNAFVTKDAELQARWIQLVKLSVLKELVVNEKDARLIKSNYKPIADKAYAKYQNVIHRKKQVAGGTDLFLFNKLLNAIASVYDPHTEFYPANEKQSFLDILSTDHYSFGFLLEDDPMGNVIIGRIIPGSSAWDVKNVHVGDVVTAIHSAHIEKIDASLYSSEEIDEILEKISTEVYLSLRKADGSEITVTLLKQRVREDDNKIKSLVIGNTQTQFGYVNLPIFFSKSEISKTGCATELAKEIINLKNAKIKGLILDLRNNGGGDLDEAIDLAGIFVDRGALAITKYRAGEAETLKDSNLGMAYDGPLVIMINGASASASELFAAAMRDHNRGILLGTTTYGKATGQSVMFLDASRKDMTKITSFRFFDIKGTSHQGYGLVPDIQLPDMLSEFNYSERVQRYALPADRIQKKTYYTPWAPLPIDILKDSANQRIARNPFFQNLTKRKQKIAPYRHGSEFKIPLTPEGFLKMNFALDDDMPDFNPVSDLYNIKLTSFDQQVTGIDTFGQETFHNLIKNVSQDFYIAEALKILSDFNQLKK